MLTQTEIRRMTKDRGAFAKGLRELAQADWHDLSTLYKDVAQLRQYKANLSERFTEDELGGGLRSPLHRVEKLLKATVNRIVALELPELVSHEEREGRVQEILDGRKPSGYRSMTKARFQKEMQEINKQMGRLVNLVGKAEQLLDRAGPKN